VSSIPLPEDAGLHLHPSTFGGEMEIDNSASFFGPSYGLLLHAQEDKGKGKGKGNGKVVPVLN
jgi:hypothetical protein